MICNKFAGAQDFIPQIACRVFVVIFRRVVPRAAIFSPFVEWQKSSISPRQSSRHIDLTLTDSKVNQGPAFERQQRFGFVRFGILGQSSFLVLVNRILNCLLELALQFQRCDRDAVYE